MTLENLRNLEKIGKVKSQVTNQDEKCVGSWQSFMLKADNKGSRVRCAQTLDVMLGVFNN